MLLCRRQHEDHRHDLIVRNVPDYSTVSIQFWIPPQIGFAS